MAAGCYNASMKPALDRRRTPDVPRPEHGQRRGDKRVAKALAAAGAPSWSQQAMVWWAVAAAIGALVGVLLLGR